MCMSTVCTSANHGSRGPSASQSRNAPFDETGSDATDPAEPAPVRRGRSRGGSRGCATGSCRRRTPPSRSRRARGSAERCGVLGGIHARSFDSTSWSAAPLTLPVRSDASEGSVQPDCAMVRSNRVPRAARASSDRRERLPVPGSADAIVAQGVDVDDEHVHLVGPRTTRGEREDREQRDAMHVGQRGFVPWISRSIACSSRKVVRAASSSMRL